MVNEFVEIGDCQILRISGNFFIEGEYPSDGRFSIFIIDRIYGVVGGTGCV